VLSEEVCVVGVGLSGKFTGVSTGAALDGRPAKSTAIAMHTAADVRVRANRLTSILLREPIAQTGLRGMSFLQRDAMYNSHLRFARSRTRPAFPFGGDRRPEIRKPA